MPALCAVIKNFELLHKDVMVIIELFMQLKAMLTDVEIMFEAETLSREWPVVLICSKYF